MKVIPFEPKKEVKTPEPELDEHTKKLLIQAEDLVKMIKDGKIKAFALSCVADDDMLLHGWSEGENLPLLMAAVVRTAHRMNLRMDDTFTLT